MSKNLSFNLCDTVTGMYRDRTQTDPTRAVAAIECSSSYHSRKQGHLLFFFFCLPAAGSTLVVRAETSWQQEWHGHVTVHCCWRLTSCGQPGIAFTSLPSPGEGMGSAAHLFEPLQTIEFNDYGCRNRWCLKVPGSAGHSRPVFCVNSSLAAGCGTAVASTSVV
jgi:hypothetical protein